MAVMESRNGTAEENSGCENKPHPRHFLTISLASRRAAFVRCW